MLKKSVWPFARRTTCQKYWTSDFQL